MAKTTPSTQQDETPKEDSKKTETPETSESNAPQVIVPEFDVQDPQFDLRQLLDVGAHFGHKSSNWHPNMKPYIYMKRDGVHIFDLEKTANLLAKACTYVYELGKKGKTLVFVGTKRQARDIIRAEAQKAGAGFVMNRWLGGTITNWQQISKSIKRMKELEKGLEQGKFDHYTKKERVDLRKEMQRYERFFGGLKHLNDIPDALFVVDIRKEKTAVREADDRGVPVVALCDSNVNPETIDYIIPTNDDATRTIKYMVSAIAQAYGAGRKQNKRK